MSSNTRQQILHRCYEAIQTQGFELLRTDKEIIRLKITKGAFYHYFPNKLELGYAVIDEILLPNYSKKWETLLSIKTNIGNTIVNLLEHEKNQVTEKSIKKGDILYNLMVEMSHIDEVFREKLENVHDMQVTMLQRAILTGRASGEFKNTMDARSLAMNIIGGLIGCYSIAKVRNSKDVFTAMISTLQKQVRESLVMEFSNENSLINRSGNSKVDLAFNDKVAFIDSDSNNTLTEENINTKSMIDIGCGDGRLSREIKRSFPECTVTGIDYSKRAINLAMAMNQDMPEINFIAQDIINERINQKHDVAILMEVYEHIPLDQTNEFLIGV